MIRIWTGRPTCKPISIRLYVNIQTYISMFPLHDMLSSYIPNPYTS